MNLRILRRASPARVRRFAAAVAVVPVTLSALVLGGAAPASAAPMALSLSIDQVTGCMDARGTIPMGQYETWGYLNNGAHARLDVWGDDPLWDDELYTALWAYLNRPAGPLVITGDPLGIVVKWKNCLPMQLLNEDWGEFEDEFYVKVTVIDGDGHTLSRAKSNTVSWCCHF
jgi:hypothetical protein